MQRRSCSCYARRSINREQRRSRFAWLRIRASASSKNPRPFHEMREPRRLPYLRRFKNPFQPARRRSFRPDRQPAGRYKCSVIIIMSLPGHCDMSTNLSLYLAALEYRRVPSPRLTFRLPQINRSISIIAIFEHIHKIKPLLAIFHQIIPVFSLYHPRLRFYCSVSTKPLQ